VPADLAYFSHVIVQAEEAEHEKIAAIPGLRANTAEGRWRLYKTAGEGIPR
jgi:hypothetical protein